MKEKINRLVLFLVGLLVFCLPAIFFYYEINEVYNISIRNIEESLRQKLLSSVTKLENDLDPFNYLKSEFEKIHATLFPSFPDQIFNGIPEEKYVKDLYTQKTLDRLLLLIKERFQPIIITMGNQGFKELFSYHCPELEKKFENKEDIERLSKLRFYEDLYVLKTLYYNHYNKFIKSLDEADISINQYKEQNKRIFYNENYKYQTRFNNYQNNLIPAYTDYYNKQLLYPIIQYSFSKKEVYGYYSLYIPQSHIVPEEVVNYAISNNDPDVKICFDEDDSSTNIIKTSNGFKYYLSIPTTLSFHIKDFKRLRNIDQTYLLNKKIKLEVFYPEEIINLERLKKISFISVIIILITYTIIFLLTINNKITLPNITKKLAFILFIIIFVPLISTELLIWNSINNVDEVIDYNVSKSLKNEIEKINIKNKENNLRQVTNVFEIKRKISNSDFNLKFDTLENHLLTNYELYSWFKTWNRDLQIITSEGKYSAFNYVKKTNKSKSNKYILSKYANNLGILSKSRNKKSNEFAQDATLGLLEKYITPEIEADSIGQESVPHKKVMSWIDNDLAIYFYAKDNKNRKILLTTYRRDTQHDPYRYLDSIFETSNFLYFRPKNKFAEIDLALSLNSHKERGKKNWPAQNFLNKDLKDSITMSLDSKDSGHSVSKLKNGSLIKEWLFSHNDPIVIIGTAKSHYDKMIYFILNMIIPSILVYATILLILLTNFISSLIKQPIQIYRKAISNLTSNLGLTIKSFSKDEFNYITNAFNEMSIALKQKEQIKRYVSDRLVQSIEENKIQKAGNGKQEQVTILSSDIRNFTGISEQFEPYVIVEMLNTYFTKMQQAISNNGGIIDKYIGDAIQAVFYDEPNKENQVIRASKAAIAMRKALKELNEERKTKGLFTIENGIGIDTDFAITGTIGTSKGRKDFSVNGEVIAKAAELEAKTKKTTSKILISKKSIDWIATASKQPRNDVQRDVREDRLVYKIFDEETVELLDVR